MRAVASLADSLLLSAQRSRALGVALRKTCVDLAALSGSYTSRVEQVLARFSCVSRVLLIDS